MRNLVCAAATAALVLLSAGTAISAEPIEGTWLRPSTGTIVVFAGNGGKFCGTVQNGEFKGKSIGCMNGSGADYKGSITDLKENKTFSGRAKITPAGMKLEGCVAMVLCKGEVWKRQ